MIKGGVLGVVFSTATYIGGEIANNFFIYLKSKLSSISALLKKQMKELANFHELNSPRKIKPALLILYSYIRVGGRPHNFLRDNLL
jgi:hypothetical protein